MRRTSQKWYNMQYINMSGNLPMGIAYPPRPLAEPRSGRYAGCRCTAGEVFGCIPHGCAGEAMLRREAARSAPGGTARCRARAYRESDSFTMGSDPIVFRVSERGNLGAVTVHYNFFYALGTLVSLGHWMPFQITCEVNE